VLGDIPLLGAIFRSKEKTVKNTELIVFITPIVVVNQTDGGTDELNAAYKEKLEKVKGRLRDAEPDALKTSPRRNSRRTRAPGLRWPLTTAARAPSPAPDKPK